MLGCHPWLHHISSYVCERKGGAIHALSYHSTCIAPCPHLLCRGLAPPLLRSQDLRSPVLVDDGRCGIQLCEAGEFDICILRGRWQLGREVGGHLVRGNERLIARRVSVA